MQAPTASASSEPPPPRTRRTPTATNTTPTACSASGTPATASTNTGADPRASGYTAESSSREYANASSVKYRSSSAADATIQGRAAECTWPRRDGRKTTHPTHIPAAVAACESRAPASSRFHSAWTNAAASASASAEAGTQALRRPRELPRVEPLVGADHMHHRVDQREVGERLREVPEMPPRVRVYLLRVQVQ